MEVYLDNSATTMCYPEVGELVYNVMCRDYGNPSSMHRKGVQAEHYIREAKETISRLLKVNAKEIFFTSGGTESDNLALIGCARANRRNGNHLITSSVEHPAILNTMRYLEERKGFRVTYLPVDEYGRIRLEALKEALCPETILVSIMCVNNELGTVQPVQEAARMVKQYKPSILFHTDAVRDTGSTGSGPKRMGIDLLTASGHKIHGPKGVGFLYIDSQGEDPSDRLRRRAAEGHPLPERRMPRIAGLGLASKMIYQDLDRKNETMRQLKARFLEGISGSNTRRCSFTDENSAPHIVSVGFAGVRSEVLLHALEDKGIYVSSGSACASNHPAVSRVLKGIRASGEYLESTLRFSMSEFTTKEEIDYTLETLYNCIPMLRRFTRR